MSRPVLRCSATCAVQPATRAIAKHGVNSVRGSPTASRITAVLLDAVGLPREQFAPTFAVGRIAGWSAHVSEQRRTGRLIRPASRYVGA